MANPSKIKGTRFESDVVAHLRENGFPHAERRALAGNVDKGDITGLGPRWVIECKAVAAIKLAEFVDEAECERVNAGADYGVAVVKRRGKGVSRAYAVMEWDKFVELMGEVEGAQHTTVL
jgi:hypothetical protein